jgi:hypothetical protein
MRQALIHTMLAILKTSSGLHKGNLAMITTSKQAPTSSMKWNSNAVLLPPLPSTSNYCTPSTCLHHAPLISSVLHLIFPLGHNLNFGTPCTLFHQNPPFLSYDCGLQWRYGIHLWYQVWAPINEDSLPWLVPHYNLLPTSEPYKKQELSDAC